MSNHESTEMQTEQSAVRFHGGDDDSGGVFAVETIFPAGLALGSHIHPHGHLSVLAQGTAIVTVDGVSSEMTGPCVVSIPANTVHMVAAKTPVVWYCLWAKDVAPLDEARASLKIVNDAIQEAACV